METKWLVNVMVMLFIDPSHRHHHTMLNTHIVVPRSLLATENNNPELPDFVCKAAGTNLRRKWK